MAIPILALLLAIFCSCSSHEAAADRSESTEARVTHVGIQPTLLAKLVDGELAPISNLHVCWTVGLRKTNSAWGVNGKVRTDELGGIRIPLGDEVSGWELSDVTFESCGSTEVGEAASAVYAALDLPKGFKAGELDLGELILVAYGDPRRFRRLDDQSLRSAFSESMSWTARSSDWSLGTPSEEMLFEMVRRGGRSWEEFISVQLAAARERTSESFHGPGELELLTALRRIQHKPDPLAVVIDSDSVLEATFPASPTIAFELKNVDPDSQAFEMTHGGSYRSGRFARINVQAISSNGKLLPPRKWDAFWGGGMSSSRALAPGESLSGALTLGDYVALTSPGAYRIRLRYHDKNDIDSAQSLLGRFVWSSEEFQIQIHPLRIELGQARAREIREWIQAVDLKKSHPLVSAHWHPALTFEGVAVWPEDKVFRAGWQAVPALYEAMQDPAIDPDRRAWVFGMLWNILGVVNPATFRPLGAMRRIEWIEKWPTSSGGGQERLSEFGTLSLDGLDPQAQEALAKAWQQWRGLIDIKILP